MTGFLSVYEDSRLSRGDRFDVDPVVGPGGVTTRLSSRAHSTEPAPISVAVWRVSATAVAGCRTSGGHRAERAALSGADQRHRRRDPGIFGGAVMTIEMSSTIIV
jgi:hypothetical protein